MIAELHFLDTGHCLASESMLIRGGAQRVVECHALVALLRHERQGWALFDTGYAPRLLEATARLPFSLYRRATPLRLRPELAAVEQIGRSGLCAADVRHVILSHFHADHLAGLRDFPAARIACAGEAYADVRGRRDWSALCVGFVPALMPDDFEARVCPVTSYEGPELPPFGRTHDLFGDGSSLLVPLPGHARGQVGLFLPQTPRGPVLLAADGAYLTRSVREGVPPHPATDLFADDGRAARETVSRLHHFHLARPDVTVVPTHCPEAYARFVEPFA